MNKKTRAKDASEIVSEEERMSPEFQKEIDRFIKKSLSIYKI